MSMTLRTALALFITFCSFVPRVGMPMMAGVAPDSPASRQDPIIANSPWSGVVAIKIGTGVYSGVLLSSRHVLTAAHVAGGLAGNPADLKVVVNLPGAASAIPASRIDVFPSFSFPYDDLALVLLSSDAPDDAIRYVVQDGPISPGATIITLVGYGGSGQGDTGVNVGGNEFIRRVGENVVDVLAEKVDASVRTSAFYLYDFDGPTGNGQMGGSTLGNARETMVAPGDSGSPAFVTSAGRNVVMGINTFAAPGKGSPNITYTFGNGGGGIRLSDPRFIQWLRATSANEIHLASEPISPQSYPLVPVVAGIAVATAGAGGLAWLITHKRQQRK
jgi:hypothetical protein